jgi:hypothetical protein
VHAFMHAAWKRRPERCGPPVAALLNMQARPVTRHRRGCSSRSPRASSCLSQPWW